MNIFQAGVQYDDFKGTVAADRADEKSFIDYLKENGFADRNEVCVGIRFGFSENHSRDVNVDSVTIYLNRTDSFEKRPSEVRAVDIQMPIAEFFSFFKRFDLVLTQSGVELDENTLVDGPHYE